MELSNQVRTFRARERISQTELAKRIGVSRQTIHAIEAGKISPSVTIALKISEVLSVPVDELFSLIPRDGKRKTYIIGIGGVSQSGKSTLAETLQNKLADKEVKIISMDDHTVPEYEMPQVHGLPDWEQPESYDFNKIAKLIKQSESTADVIIVEGIHALSNDPISKKMDLRIMLEIPYNTFLKRRRKETRWGAEPEWYYDHVWNMYLKYKPENKSIIWVSGKDTPFEQLLEKIRSEV